VACHNGSIASWRCPSRLLGEDAISCLQCAADRKSGGISTSGEQNIRLSMTARSGLELHPQFREDRSARSREARANVGHSQDRDRSNSPSAFNCARWNAPRNPCEWDGQVEDWPHNACPVCDRWDRAGAKPSGAHLTPSGPSRYQSPNSFRSLAAKFVERASTLQADRCADKSLPTSARKMPSGRSAPGRHGTNTRGHFDAEGQVARGAARPAPPNAEPS